MKKTKKKNYFERAASGVNSVRLDSTIRSRASRELSNAKVVYSLKLPSLFLRTSSKSTAVGFNEKDDGSTCDLQVGDGKPIWIRQLSCEHSCGRVR